ncbi:MAG: S-methyl-5-thioribose-1-phosphate isomerase [Candidatus Aenigmarchaeota archaeon]|nr:S-methyl-5-thioribose-1-phosphate isomerase [Candidatus Aenigmarchaeota archaeon]
MKVDGKDYRTVWMKGRSVFLIDQNKLPFSFEIYESKCCIDTCKAVETMLVRGAGAIGAAAGFAMAQAFLESSSAKAIEEAKRRIEATRPTAQNLFYATKRVFSATNHSAEAQKIADEDADSCRKIGEYGNKLIDSGSAVETHCNAGWLAFVDYGTALSPMYAAHRSGKDLMVYVDETRPRGQGAKLTAWELKNEGVPHKIIPDNAGALLMSRGKVDVMIVGADRIARNGDAANKIGTLEKAIVAKELGVPFYVAAPTSTIDMNCKSGEGIPIEERDEDEVLYQTGRDESGGLRKVLVCSPGSHALNISFDVTPAKYITGIITEKGVISAKEADVKRMLAR